MGKTKKVGIVIGVVLGLFVIVAGLFSGSTTAEDKQLSKYDGLTQGQITNVRLLEDSCKNNAMMAYSQGGATAEEIYSKRCSMVIEDKIQDYRYENTVKSLSISKEYSLCHTVSDNLLCLIDVAKNTGDASACDEILNSIPGSDQIYDENTTHLEHYRNLCLENLN